MNLETQIPAPRILEPNGTNHPYIHKTFALLNTALAGEIMCVLRYRHHQVIAKGIQSLAVAAEFAEHAESEAFHMLRIAERIDQLGGDPDFNPAHIVAQSPTQYGSDAGVPLAMLIRENLVAERAAVLLYKKMIQYFGNSDPTSRRLFEEILQDEEEHVHDLDNLL